MCLAIPGQIVEIVDETFQIAKVNVGGVKRGVNIALIAACTSRWFREGSERTLVSPTKVKGKRENDVVA